MLQKVSKILTVNVKIQSCEFTVRLAEVEQ